MLRISLAACTLTCAAVPFTSVALAQDVPLGLEGTYEWAQARLANVRMRSTDRSTPENALQSFFRFFNDRSEIMCVGQAVRAREGETRAQDAYRKESDSIRDSFFSGDPLLHFHKYDYLRPGQTFDRCMRDRETVGYEVRGVEPIGSETTKILVQAKNTTPLSQAMKPTPDDLEDRRNGTMFRFTFKKKGVEWKIVGLEEKADGLDLWFDKFDRRWLDPLVPSRVTLDAL